MSAWTYRSSDGKAAQRLFRLVFESHDGRAPGADSEEKHEPASDIDCINRPDRRLHPTNATTPIYLLQCGSHPQRTDGPVQVRCPERGHPIVLAPDCSLMRMETLHR